MARVTEYGTTSGSNPFESDQNSQTGNTQIISADQQGPLQVPGDDFIADADILREGQDLILEAPDGSTIVIEGYFNADPAPMITAPDGSALTPKMVLNFVQDAGDLQYARADSVVDESPVGQVLEVDGQATVTRVNGSSEPLMIGMKIYEGDIIETSGTGAVNIQFIDDSTFAVSENARLAIDEYVFDPQTDSGSTNFSVLRGLFVFTSGLIGRDDPDDVQIDTPVGSIGIRGTTIMGNVDTGEITVVEGAVVLRNFDGNELTLDEQFETGRFVPATGEIILVGTLAGEDMAQNFDSVSGVMPSLFSGFVDAGANDQQQPTNDPALVADAGTTDGTASQDTASQDGETQTAAADDAANMSGDGTTQVASADETTTDDTTTAGAGTADGTADGTTTDTTQVASADTTQQTTADGQTTTDDQTADTTDTTTVASADGTSDNTATDTTDPFVVAGSTGFTDATGTGSTSDGGIMSGSTSTTSTITTAGTTTSGSTTTSTNSGATTTATNPPPPPPLDIAINHLAVEDSLATGQVIAVVGTTYDFPDVRFTLLDDLGGQIALIDNPIGNKAEIRLVSGSLTAGTPLDIVVRAALPDGRVTTENFNVDVVDTNAAPTITNDGAVFNVDENSSGGTNVGQVIATDVDAGQTLSYYITSGAPVGLFLIDSSGNITVNGALDAEAVGSYSLNVRVQDDGMGALYDLGSYTITINDINEAPTITAPAGNYSVAEDAINGAVVVDATTMGGLSSDPDGDTLTYSITGGNTGGAFSINPTTGAITVNGGVLDYESGTTQYTLQVTATDGGALTATQNFVIDLTDINEAPTITAPSGNYSVAEDAADATVVVSGTAMGGLSSDPDGDTLTYSITAGNTGGAFSINPTTGAITVNGGVIDYESGTTQYTLQVTATDGGALTATQNFVIDVTDINEAPTITAPSGNYSVAEDAADATVVVSGTEMGGLSSDPDGDALTYSITAGNTGGAFSINSTTGAITVNGGILDYDSATTQYTLTVTATDGGSLTGTQDFVIDLTGVDDEASTLDTNAGASIEVGSVTTLTTSMLSSSDVDTSDTGITYTITTDVTHGHIALASDPATPVTAFTQDDLVNGNVVYVNDGTATSADSFDFTVGDGTNGTAAGTFAITINDTTAPSLEVNGTGTHLSGLSSFSSLTTGLHMMFDEDVQAGIGNIYVREFGTSNLISTIDVTDTNLVSFSGGEVKIRIPDDLLYETGYYVEVDNGAITDLAGNGFSGFTGSGTFNFSTGRQTFLTTVGGLGSDGAYGTLELHDPVTNKSDGYIMVGETAIVGQQDDIVITKLDNHGFAEDVLAFGGTGIESFAGIAHNSAGVFIGGTTDSAGQGLEDFMLTSVDLNGNVVWSNAYGTSGSEFAESVVHAANPINTDVYMAGKSLIGGYEVMTVASINGGTGALNWSVNLSESLVDVSADAILSMSAGKYFEDLIVGGDSSINGGDIMIARLSDANGSLSWAYTISMGASDEKLESMVETSDGGFLLAGSTTAGDVTGDALLMKVGTDASGNNPGIAWAVTMGVGSQVDAIHDVIELGDGRIAITGSYNSLDGFVAVLNADGTWAWGSSFSTSDGATSAYSVEETLDGTLLISGETASGAGSSDAFALQMTLSGQVENKVGTYITNSSLGDNWSISTLSSGTLTTLTVGTDITMALDGSITGGGAGLTTNGTGFTSVSADDVDHADDVFGGTNNDYQLPGTASDDLGLSAIGSDGVISGFAGNDTIYSDGKDIINGGTGDDTIVVDALAKFAAGATLFDHDLGYVDGGVGNDVFRLDSDHDLDLSMMRDGDALGLNNIEFIDMNDGSNSAQQLTLSYEAIVAMTDNVNALVIDGDTTANNDSVIVDLAAAGTVGVDAGGGGMGAGYTDYSVTGASGTIHLYVADSVDQTGITTA